MLDCSPSLRQQLRAEAARRGLIAADPLWPDEFDGSPKGAWRFVQVCRTWNEAEGEEQPFPDKEYLREITRHWRECRKTGQPLIIEKSRRLITSWVLRALELHDLGLKQGDGIITHRTHEDAAEHVWRIYYLYESLRKRNPDWRLRPAKTYGALADKKLDSLVLPNGSKVEKHFEKPEGLQGSGYAFVTMEELSIYRNPGTMWAQAKFVTQASALGTNGLRVAVTNASPNKEWQELKA